MAKHWSPEDDETIRSAYPSLGKSLEIEGKSEGAIRQRAHVLGVKFNPAEAKLIEHGLDPNEWEPTQVWSKTGGASLKYRRKNLDLREVLSSVKPGKVSIPKPAPKTGLMLEVGEVDAHFGKLCWKPETNFDYDLGIAVKVHREAAARFMAEFKGQKFDRVLLLGGQDCLHIANPEGTTSRGTQLDFDSRFQKIVKARIEYELWRVEAWSRYGPITYVSSPGNHSFVAEMLLAEVVRARFGNQIEIMDAPSDRQYLRFGKVGLGFSHGDKTKPQRARELFAAEAPSIWGSTEFREFHTGHLHAESCNSGPGCTNRVLAALCPPDKWHSDQGFINQPKTQAFVWCRERGLRTIHFQ